MNTALAPQQHKKSLLATVAARFEMEPGAFLETIKQTVFPKNKDGKEATNEQVAAFLAVAQQYDLNPFTREIYAFPSSRGGIHPIVSIDGWLKLINSHPAFDGMEIEEICDQAGKLIAVKCSIHRKDRNHPTTLTQWLQECYRDTEPWKQMPSRMLTHKAVKECGRYAFGFAGITDEDEARDAIEHEVIPPEPIQLPRRVVQEIQASASEIVQAQAPVVVEVEAQTDEPQMPRRKERA